ncbi:hypothetical protein CGRA01v4_14450 [Colletotrichum graminicola]|nr:hypothetical protein CGRA01v4_14450 [Colletotrichum graminicola]
MGAPWPGSVCHTRLARNQLYPSTIIWPSRRTKGGGGGGKGQRWHSTGWLAALWSSRSAQKRRLTGRQKANWFGRCVCLARSYQLGTTSFQLTER